VKARRYIALALAIFILSSVDVFARSIWGDYNGYSKVKLMVNEEEKKFYSSDDVPAIIMDNRTMLPMRAAADSMNAMVTFDDANQTIHLYRPNVHLFPVKDVSKSSKGEYTLKGPFSIVNKGETIDFKVFTQVDNLKVGISAIKLSIITPSGKTPTSPFISEITDSSESFWYPIPINGYTFNESGIYTLQYSMKMTDSWEYTVVAQKEIISK
jgi:hypothetical protein